MISAKAVGPGFERSVPESISIRPFRLTGGYPPGTKFWHRLAEGVGQLSNISYLKPSFNL